MSNIRRVRRTKRNASERNRPPLPFTRVILVFCLLSALAFIGTLYEAVRSSGNIQNAVAGVGVLWMAADIGFVILGARRMKNATYSLSSRLAALLLPVITAGMWIYIYLTGALVA